MALVCAFQNRVLAGRKQQAARCHGMSMTLPPMSRGAALRQQQTAPSSRVHAFVPTLGNEKRVSLDPMADSWKEDWLPGRLLTVQSPQQFDKLLDTHPDKLVVLMCKSHSCRPCKAFMRKALAIAERFPECIMCEVYGDETPDTRKMMIQMQVKVTPTFRMYRQKECVNIVTGTNEKKLMRGMLAHLSAAELAAHEREIEETHEVEEAAAAAQ